jgi:hypothetical protein
LSAKLFVPVTNMSSGESTNPDPAVVPQDPVEAKGDVQPVQPSSSKVPKEVQTTISKADETIIRISKYVK